MSIEVLTLFIERVSQGGTDDVEVLTLL